MAKLISSSSIVEQMTGLCLKGTMLTTTQYHDRRHVLPLVLSTKSQDFLLVRQIETGNLKGCGFASMPVVYFSPYFIPGGSAGKAANTVTEAVQNLIGSEPLCVDASLPVRILEELKNELEVEVTREEPVPIRAFSLSRSEVLARFNHHRPQVAEVAKELTRDHPQQERLSYWYEERPDKRFEMLDQLLSAHGIRGILANWFVNFQELSGLPGKLAEHHGYAALYLTNVDEIWVFAPDNNLVVGEVHAAESYPSLSRAIKDIVGTDLIGYEADAMPAGVFVDLRDIGVNLVDGGSIFRQWREEKTVNDIPYFVVAAQASRYAMEGAADFAEQAIKAGVEITERDVDRVYLSRLGEFAHDYRLPVSLDFYFTNNHAGSRTIYPSRPANYLLNRGINSLKIDAGVFVVDDGLYHACSDIARTITTTEAGREVHQVMNRVMLDETIPSIRSGMTGSEIYEVGIDQVARQESVFRKYGLIPDNFSWRRDYKRNIGHLIERQESNTFNFERGETRVVRAGMVGCIEYHCPYAGYAITVEDTFVTDDDGSILISTDPAKV